MSRRFLQIVVANNSHELNNIPLYFPRRNLRIKQLGISTLPIGRLYKYVGLLFEGNEPKDYVVQNMLRQNDIAVTSESHMRISFEKNC
jgi:hypothetical protein